MPDKINYMNPLLRLFAYISIFLAYILFMRTYAPLGVYWLDFHAQRIFNAVEFLKLNGYLSFYGYTIWDTCKDCLLDASIWEESIYFSSHGINLIPYAIINHFGGKEYLLLLGPMLDKLIIFICATLVAELVIKSTISLTRFPSNLIGIASFSLFALAPWTYKMIIAPWAETYFLMFLLFGMLAFSAQKTRWGFIAFFMAGLSHYQWAAVTGVFYLLLIAVQNLFSKDINSISKYFPPHHGLQKHRLKVLLSITLPVFLLILFRLFVQQYYEPGSGSSMFERVGISGNDIRNGGLLGALQFLGGARFTQCFQGLGIQVLSTDTAMIVAFYNCLFSLAGMAILSVISMIGIYFLVQKSNLAMQVFLPLIFAMLCMITLLQQSLSVHLMGYSFIFSALLSAGIIMMMILLQNKLSSPLLGLIFSIPCLAGILILSIRASMLSGMS